MMSKDKQIEEMTETINDLYGSDAMYYGVDSYGIATALYNAGYRKQSKGEWVWKKKIEPQAQNRLYCSVCDKECLAKNNYYVKSNFCPNCGAKMKGESEDA